MPTFPLNIIQKNSKVWRISSCQFIIKKFINKDFINSIFTRCFHRTNCFDNIISFNNQIVLI